MEYPPGWYEDPDNKTLLRWWDGHDWAEESQPALQNDSRSSNHPAVALSNHPVAARYRKSEYDPRRSEYESQPQRHLGPGDLLDPVGRRDFARTLSDQNLARAHSDIVRNGTQVTADEDHHYIDIRKSSNVTLTLSALFAVSLALIAVGYLFNAPVVRLAGVLGAMFFGIGGVPLRGLQHARLSTRLAIAVLAGISVPTLLASVMVLVPVWHPLLCAAILGAAVAVIHLRGARDALLTIRSPMQRNSIRFNIGSAFNSSIGLSAVGTLLWVGAMAASGRIDPGPDGFLTQISPIWYIGLVLVLGGLVLARGRAELSAAIALSSLVAALTVTPAYVYGLPRIQTAAKHIGFVQQVLSAHYLDIHAGIYQAYSGFFNLNGFICYIAGVNNSIGLATYWTAIINITGLFVFRLFFGNLLRSTYRVYVALALSFLVNAIGQDYFSPQSVGFVLAFGIFGLVIGAKKSEIDDKTRMSLLCVISCAIAVTHELSPYAAAAVLIIFVVFRIIRPWYLPGVVLVPAVLWALINHGVVGQNASLSDLGSFANFTPPKTVATSGLERLPIVGQGTDALLFGLLVLILLAGVGFLAAAARRPSWGFFSPSYAWAMVISAGSGLGLILGNSYGNEGIFRSALFAIPWLAVLAAASVPKAAPGWLTIPTGCLLAVLTATHAFAASSLDNANVIRPGDVNAVDYYMEHASINGYMLQLSYGDTPIKLAPIQDSHLVLWTQLGPTARPVLVPSQADITGLAENYVDYASHNGGSLSELYAIWSPASVDDSVDYGLESLATAEDWRTLMSSNHDWQLVYSSDGTYLFRVVVGNVSK